MRHRTRLSLPRPSASPARTVAADATLLARSGRAALTALTAFVLAAALLLVWAAAAHAAGVWVIPAASRAFPGTAAGTRQTIALDAAGGEYQGIQVCLRGPQRKVSFSWSQDSDPLITAEAQLSRVYYVKVTTPTTHLGAKRGWYPDPLVPRSFGEQQNVPGSYNPGPTTPFYILVHVPYGTPAGSHTATLHVVNGPEVVDIPVSLRVWDFGWARISTRTAMPIEQFALKGSLPRNYALKGANKVKLLTNWYTMMKQHGLSPTSLMALPRVSSSGNVSNGGAWADEVSPYLDEEEGKVGLQDNQLLFKSWFPWSGGAAETSSRILTYLTDMARLYKSRGWDTKSYMYRIDEPTTTGAERQAERYGRLMHKADNATGAKVKFFLTDDPRPRTIGRGHPGNKFLYDDVDIWCTRYYYFFGRIPALRERQKAGKEIWWYTYVNNSVGRTPSFVIDKPHVDSRAWGWLMQKWNVTGLLNWGFNRWLSVNGGTGYHDPFRYPLSHHKNPIYSNGETVLAYPGYYPRYGLNDPTAAPCSSLRLEALRDGLEEREYLKLAATLPGGPTLVTSALQHVTQFPYPIKQAVVFNFPIYSRKGSVYDTQRTRVAQFIEEAREPQ